MSFKDEIKKAVYILSVGGIQKTKEIKLKKKIKTDIGPFVLGIEKKIEINCYF